MSSYPTPDFTPFEDLMAEAKQAVLSAPLYYHADLIKRLAAAVDVQTNKLIDISLTIADVDLEARTNKDAIKRVRKLSKQSYLLTDTGK